MDAMNDRRRGALIGLAVGDALGAAVDFSLDFGSQPQEHALERKKQPRRAGQVNLSISS
jgi:hypothetical protein